MRVQFQFGLVEISSHVSLAVKYPFSVQTTLIRSPTAWLTWVFQPRRRPARDSLLPSSIRQSDRSTAVEQLEPELERAMIPQTDSVAPRQRNAVREHVDARARTTLGDGFVTTPRRYCVPFIDCDARRN